MKSRSDRATRRESLGGFGLVDPLYLPIGHAQLHDSGADDELVRVERVVTGIAKGGDDGDDDYPDHADEELMGGDNRDGNADGYAGDGEEYPPIDFAPVAHRLELPDRAHGERRAILVEVAVSSEEQVVAYYVMSQFKAQCEVGIESAVISAGE